VYFADRDVGSKLVLYATIPFHCDRKPFPTFIDEETAEKTKNRWQKYGLDY